MGTANPFFLGYLLFRYYSKDLLMMLTILKELPRIRWRVCRLRDFIRARHATMNYEHISIFV